MGDNARAGEAAVAGETPVTPGEEPFDPPSLPGSSARLPTFDDIPPALRQVLVVDDNAVFRGFLRALLRAQGFTVHEAGDGAEGLAVALDKRPWLILTDVRMPVLDGFELCRCVRGHSLVRHTPLLLLSGGDDYKARHHGLEMGADDFVPKDAPVRELLIRIQLALKRYIALGRRGGGAAMEGRVDVMGAPGVLQACHLTRLTGILTAEGAGTRVAMRFLDGELVGASGDGHYGADAVYAFLGWDEGRFTFVPGDPGSDRRLEPSFGELLLEGCRRLDEKRRREAPAEPESR